MSSPRVQKIFEAMPNQLRRLGKYDVDFREVVRWQGRISADTDGYEGFDACVIDLDSATWSTLNKRVLLVAEAAADQNRTQAMLTQSHASGHFLDGSVRFHAYMESPVEFFGASAAAKAYAKFIHLVQQHIVGQLAAPLQIHFVDATDEPELDGANGASATAPSEAMEWLLPYGMTYPGGV